MVDKKDLKLGLVLPFAILALIVLSAIVYVFLSSEQGNMGLSLGETIALIVLTAGLLVVIPLFLTSVDVLQSKQMSNKKKIAWLLTLWIAPGGILAAIYHFFKKKD